MSLRRSTSTYRYGRAAKGEVFIARLHKVLVAFSLLLGGWAALSLPALAQDAGAASSFDLLSGSTLRAVAYLGDAMYKRIYEGSVAFFLTAASLRGAIYYLRLMGERKRGHEDGVIYFLNRMVRLLLFVGIIGLLIRTSSTWMGLITSGMLEVAAIITGGAGFTQNGDPVGPGAIFQMGWALFLECFEIMTAINNPETPEEEWGLVSGLKRMWVEFNQIREMVLSPQIWVMIIACIGIMIAFAGMAIRILFIEFVYAIVAGMMPFFLSFAVLPGFSRVASGYLRFWLQTVLRLFAVYVVLGVVLHFPELMSMVFPTDSFNIASITRYAMVDQIPPAFEQEFGLDPGAYMESSAERWKGAMGVTALAIVSFMLVKILPSRFADTVTDNIRFEWLEDLLDDDYD